MNGAFMSGIGAAIQAMMEIAKANASGPAYIVHGAQTQCSFGMAPSHVVLQVSHGVYIHNIAQLTTMDHIPLKNIQTFGGCTSPENPSVQAAAAQIAAAQRKKKKSFWEKVMSIFCKVDAEADASFVSQCAGVCTPVIIKPWDNGKETVTLSRENPLLSTGTLTCMYSGQITLSSTGQPV